MSDTNTQIVADVRRRHCHRLTTGREFYAQSGVIGLSPDLTAHEGYDGDVEEGSTTRWTREDRIALADEMIARWQAYRAKVETDAYAEVTRAQRELETLAETAFVTVRRIDAALRQAADDIGRALHSPSGQRLIAILNTLPQHEQ